MDMLCYYDPSSRMIDFTTIHPKVLSDIERAEEIADIVVVAPHWGTEYTTTQSGYQEEFARQMTEAGADIIIGTHPHVVQPVSYVESENGNKSLCYYSLGNYVSTQKQVACMLEGMAVVTLTVTPDGEISINEEETGVIPLVCQYTQGSVRIENIYFLNDYTEELAKKHGMYTYAGIPLHQEDLVNLSQKVFGEWEMKPYLDVIPLEEDTNADEKDWHCCGHHTNCETGDNCCSRTCFGLFSNFLNGFVVTGCVDFCNNTDEKTWDKTSNDSKSWCECAKEYFSKNERT
jgi:hypothetical protein